jgi:SET domain-containing protein
MQANLYVPSTKICVRLIKGKGRGVVTTRRIRAGEEIETAPVLIVPKEQIELLSSSFLVHYMFQSDNGKHLVIGLGLTSMVNHGADPNAEFFVSNECIVVKARRAIPSGAEVTVDYGWRAEEWASIGIKDPL